MGYMYKGRSGDIRVSQAKRLKGAANEPQIESSVSIVWLDEMLSCRCKSQT